MFCLLALFDSVLFLVTKIALSERLSLFRYSFLARLLAVFRMGLSARDSRSVFRVIYGSVRAPYISVNLTRERAGFQCQNSRSIWDIRVWYGGYMTGKYTEVREV
ncbi:hypothetical protein V8F20_003398, partial [Naviculisporaceae sp. PSN 640]